MPVPSCGLIKFHIGFFHFYFGGRIISYGSIGEKIFQEECDLFVMKATIPQGNSGLTYSLRIVIVNTANDRFKLRSGEGKMLEFNFNVFQKQDQLLSLRGT